MYIRLTVTKVVFEYKTSSKDLTLQEGLTVTKVVFEYKCTAKI